MRIIMYAGTSQAFYGVNFFLGGGGGGEEFIGRSRRSLILT